ncbi:type II secretion system protein [Photobacterium leiognathi]|uniref:type II secretion system protein n=1 Tax=Photobacterium leiognathi TaxID=553611 RepID=UPI000D160D1E|nr:type II secretion system protein [Photobacterium leiognathi]PSW56436.1 MSHA biogenesis protein MshA [Photobacterium leiognathi subsp. mandapamensis]
MKRQGGFTLIELVVVIVILGILAVTAAPKFMNLQNDARKASLEGLKGSMQGAAGIVYGKAAIKGIESTAADTDVKVGDITTNYGYPTADTNGIVNAVSGLETNNSDWVGNVGTNAGTYVVTFKNLAPSGATGTQIEDTGCYVKYEQAAQSAAASTTVVVTGSSCK